MLVLLNPNFKFSDFNAQLYTLQTGSYVVPTENSGGGPH